MEYPDTSRELEKIDEQIMISALASLFSFSSRHVTEGAYHSADCGEDGGVSLKVCKPCMHVRYCDAKCQRNHWPKHKKE